MFQLNRAPMDNQRMISPPALTLGRPHFLRPEVAAIAEQDGMAQAWRFAWRERGPAAAAAEVTGAFAVGLSEAPGRVFLAVDRFASCTICYRIVGHELQFSARADDFGADAREIDAQAIFDYLYFHAIPSPRTIFRGVHRVPPGHYLLFEQGRLTVAPYWVPEFTEGGAEASFDDLRDEFREILRVAVRRQMDKGKHGCFLSGGTDSSTIAGMIGEVTGKPAATYSIGFEAEGYDEMRYARIAAKQFGTEHHEYYVTPDDLVRSISTVGAHFDQPFGNSSVLPAYYCARMAQADGVTRILAGDGGDELFGGNSRYAKQRVFGWYAAIPPALRTRALEPFFGRSSVSKVPLLKKGASYIEQAKVPMPDRSESYNLLLRLGIDEVLTPEFLAHVDTAGPSEQQRTVWNASGAKSELNRTLAFDWRYTLGESDLPKVRESAGLARIDVGFPMLDADLLNFSLRLPAAYKLKGLRLRWFFKEALRGFLPDEILTKKKQGFGLPFGVWLTRHPGLKKLAVDSLASLSSRAIVRPAFLKELVERRLEEHPGYYGEMIWILMMLELWLQRHAPEYNSS